YTSRASSLSPRPISSSPNPFLNSSAVAKGSSAVIAICRILAMRISSLHFSRSGRVGEQPLEIRLHFLRISPLVANAPVPEPAADAVRALAVRADLARDAHDGLDPGP